MACVLWIGAEVAVTRGEEAGGSTNAVVFWPGGIAELNHGCEVVGPVSFEEIVGLVVYGYGIVVGVVVRESK